MKPEFVYDEIRTLDHFVSGNGGIKQGETINWDTRAGKSDDVIGACEIAYIDDWCVQIPSCG